MTSSDRFEVELLPKAEDDLDDLANQRDRAIAEILKLELNPHLGHTLKGSLRGVRSLEFTMKGGVFRALYVIDEPNRVVIVFLVGPHENIYKKAERRWAALRKAL
jgi:mRNA-degrading endonuclease RelE of RelBE toxin-antitoxin system